MINPSVDELSLHSVEELEALTRKSHEDHTAKLREMAAEYDDSERKISELKADPRKLTAELVIRDDAGKRVERFETPPVDAAGMQAALAKLTQGAMSGELVNRARRGVAEIQARRSVLGKQIQAAQEAYHRLDLKITSALTTARIRAAQDSDRHASVAKYAGQNKRARTMSEKLGLSDAGPSS